MDYYHHAFERTSNFKKKNSQKFDKYTRTSSTNSKAPTTQMNSTSFASSTVSAVDVCGFCDVTSSLALAGSGGKVVAGNGELTSPARSLARFFRPLPAPPRVPPIPTGGLKEKKQKFIILNNNFKKILCLPPQALN